MAKTVKEVCELTGLTRKLLHDYDEEGIVKPSDYKNRGYVNRDGKEYDGYKLYDDEAVLKLQQIAIFRKLHMKRSEIKKKITAIDYDSNKLLKEQISMLKKEKEEIENLIFVAEELQVLGLKNELTNYLISIGMSQHSNDSKKIKHWQDSIYYKKLYDNLEKISTEYEKENELAITELIGIEDYDTSEAMIIVRNLFDINMRYLGGIGWLFVLIMCLSGLGGGEIFQSYDIDEMGSIPENSAKAILNYIVKDMEGLKAEFEKIREEYKDIIGIDFEALCVQKMVNEVKSLLKRYFGIRSEDEYKMLFEFVEIEPYGEKYDYMNYILNAIKFYSI